MNPETHEFDYDGEPITGEWTCNFFECQGPKYGARQCLSCANYDEEPPEIPEEKCDIEGKQGRITHGGEDRFIPRPHEGEGKCSAHTPRGDD